MLDMREISIDKIYRLLDNITRPPATQSTQRPMGSVRVRPNEMTGIFTNRIFTTPTFQWDTPIQLHPTQTEIDRHCTYAIYADLSTNFIICPITRQRFAQTDEILRINYCRHIFKKEELLQWFNSHSTCPVCRYNILTGEMSTSLFS